MGYKLKNVLSAYVNVEEETFTLTVWVNDRNAQYLLPYLHVDGFLGAFWLEEEELCHDDAGHVVVHGAHQTDYTVLQDRVARDIRSYIRLSS